MLNTGTFKWKSNLAPISFYKYDFYNSQMLYKSYIEKPTTIEIELILTHHAQS